MNEAGQMIEAGQMNEAGQISEAGGQCVATDPIQTAHSPDECATGTKGRLGLPSLGYGVSGPLGSVVMRERAVLYLIDRAFAGGIRLFDSAPFYGLSQKRLGAWLEQARPGAGEVMLSSKCGTVRRNGRIGKDWRVEALAAQIAETQQDFGGRSIDFLFLHGAPPRENLPAIGDFLRAQQASGAVGALGLCALWHDDWLHALDHLPLAAMMAPLHPGSEVHRTNAGKVAARGLAFLAIETMHVPRNGLRRSLRGADLWRNLQAIRRNGLSAFVIPPAPADRSAMLGAALADRNVTAALMTSADPARLARNIAAASGICRRIPGP